MIQDKKTLKGVYHKEYGGIRWFEEKEGGHASCTAIKCCNEWMLCEKFTNNCEKCDKDYGMDGGRLAPRSHWGEETGETYSDIIRGYDEQDPDEVTPHGWNRGEDDF